MFGFSGRVVANLLSFVGVSVTFLISIGFEYLVTLVTTEGIFVTVSVVAAYADLVAVERLRVAINDPFNCTLLGHFRGSPFLYCFFYNKVLFVNSFLTRLAH